VAAVEHNPPGQAYRMAHTTDSADSSHAQLFPVHDQGVHLHVPLGIGVAATAGIESGAIFQDDDRRLHGVERRAAVDQDCAPRLGRRGASLDRVVLALCLCFPLPGSTMHDNGNRHPCTSPLLLSGIIIFLELVCRFYCT